MTHDPDHEGAEVDEAGSPSVSPLEPSSREIQHIGEAVRCIELVEQRIPPPYRTTVLESLLALDRRGDATVPASSASAIASGAAERRPDQAASGGTGLSQDEMVIDLERYAHALAGPGRLLAKALITLEIVATQMGVDWMTPAEIERFLVDRARATHVYRTNVSNALRGARGLVDRRRRGRAYEYRITEAGRVVVDREVAILGPGPLD